MFSDIIFISVTVSWYRLVYNRGCPIINFRMEMCDAEDQKSQPVISKCKVQHVCNAFVHLIDIIHFVFHTAFIIHVHVANKF